jgi:6-pyruvoyltetrahydropterin/6-carboxytetrahydropterin synthase
MSSASPSTFEIHISKPDMKFNCAHFIAFKGFRERLHGHNYVMAVKVMGSDTIGPDGYLIDFGDIKKAARGLCKSLNEYFICPMLSDAVIISNSDDGRNICMQCDDGAFFSFPVRNQIKFLVCISVQDHSSFVLS